MTANGLMPPMPPWKKRLVYVLIIIIGLGSLCGIFAWGWVKGGGALQGVQFALSFCFIVFLASLTVYICIIRPRAALSNPRRRPVVTNPSRNSCQTRTDELVPERVAHHQRLPSYLEATLDPPSYDDTLQFVQLDVCQLEADDLEKNQTPPETREMSEVRVGMEAN